MIGINRIVSRWVYIYLALIGLISLKSIAAAEEVILSGELIGNELLKVGVLQGDPAISLIQPSPFLALNYKNGFENNVCYLNYAVGMSDALLNWDARAMPNLWVTSGMLEAACCFETGDHWAVGLGMIPNFWEVFYTRSIDDKADIGWSGMKFENNTGIWTRYEISTSQQLIAGVGSNLALDCENVQNENVRRMKLYAFDRLLWIKYLSALFPDLGFEFLTNDLTDTLKAEARQPVAKNLEAAAEACWIKTKSLLYQDERTFKLGCKYSTPGFEFSPDISYIQHDPDNRQNNVNEFYAAITVSVPLGSEKQRLSLDISLDMNQQEKYLKQEHSKYHADVDPDYGPNNALYWNVHDAVTTDSYFGFLRYLETNTNNLHSVLMMAVTLGLNFDYYNYDYSDLNNDDSLWKDTLSNSATDEQIYNAIKYGMLQKQEMPVTVCRGFARFITKMINACKLPGIKAYAAEVSYRGQGHVVSMIAAPDQIYIADYYEVIQTQTRDIETAFEIYQNLYSYPCLDHHIFDENGSLKGIVDTPDGRLLQKALVVKKDIRPDEQMRNLAVKVMKKKY